jgi:CheY-like chemotaxis protein
MADAYQDNPESWASVAGRRVLVVDNEDAAIARAREILEPLDCTVNAARDGGQACSMLRSLGPDEYYDVIIAALRLPDMSGVDLFLSLRKERDVVPMVIVCGFGYDPAPTLAKAYHAGLKAMACKPFRGSQLLGAIAKAMEGAKPIGP